MVATFTRPVTGLGADPKSLPPAFSLDPAAKGRGEWLNTSTYIFYPEPGLTGGLQYTVTPNPDLKSALGSESYPAFACWKSAMPRVTGCALSTMLTANECCAPCPLMLLPVALSFCQVSPIRSPKARQSYASPMRWMLHNGVGTGRIT